MWFLKVALPGLLALALLGAAAGGNVKTIKVGEVTATWLKDNKGENKHPGKLFSAPDSLLRALGLEDGIPSTVSAFWVEANGVKILFDTGLGSGKGLLLDDLRELGVDPKDVQFVFLTHLHGDHIGGLLDGGRKVFPNAKVYLARAERDGWQAMKGKNELQMKTLEAYKDQLVLFEFGDELPGKVKALDAVGHTPGHTVFQAGKLLVIGDLIHGAALQLVHPEYSPDYDMDKPTAEKSRKRILEYAKANGLVMAGMHLPAPAFIGE